jgi:glycosyltransferase involved in cell wall biosynthesis
MPSTIAIDARKLRDFGIGTYVRNLVRELAVLDRDSQYLLFVRPDYDGSLDDLPENFRLLTERSAVYSVRELVAMSWSLYRLKVDLYHATHYVLPGFVPCPTVVTIHDIIHLLFPDYLPNRLAHYYAHRMIRRSLVRGNAIIAVSQNTRDDLASYFQLGTKKIHVIYNGVEAAFRRLHSPDDLQAILDPLGLRAPYLLFVGNPKPHKNLDSTVQAYARARELADFDAPLVCVGARAGTDFKLRQRAAQLGIEGDVVVLGHVAQEALPAIYQGASLFLYPTLYEGFGLPVIEAMASGTPVITSNNSALREVAGGYAHLVDPLDIEEIARAIAHCMTDEAHRENLCKLGLRRAETFHWSKTAEQTLALYRQVLAS